MTPALTANSQCRSGNRRAEVRIYLVVSRLELNMPYGFNVESVSIRKAEIDATVELAADVALLLGRGPAASS
ncbi:hypothetical protein AB0M79_28815 [Polymorphospora sp. NPDC051019]|uniref:hypothetical protein n=1 Tax=Polymorphospora sp. NPDC051019 TaxID=3155725 RepID=UPI00342FE1D9